tara:strand:- start:7899 stop:8444 length:546 start_codon:yes stop_codon:yes gene_type:complete
LKNIITGKNNLNIFYWIINQWGQIGSFKRNKKNNQKIHKFLVQLDKGKLFKYTFDTISSLSKVASFLNPEKYAIYDSRAIFALNWLVFNYSKEKKIFPQPIGRGKELSQYDMGTIFRLTGNTYSEHSYKEAYHEYCELLTLLENAVYGSTQSPYKIEMLLFLIAPDYIINDIQKRVSISIR